MPSSPLAGTNGAFSNLAEINSDFKYRQLQVISRGFSTYNCSQLQVLFLGPRLWLGLLSNWVPQWPPQVQLICRELSGKHIIYIYQFYQDTKE